LAGDLPKLACASGLAAHVDIERLPLSSALQAFASAQQARDWALGAGDDYELVLAVPPQRYARLASLAAKLDLRLTVVGELRRGTDVTWAFQGEELTPPVRGYEHFHRPSTQITV
jgi:thiamine-monophosphate kinase